MNPEYILKRVSKAAPSDCNDEKYNKKSKK